MVFVTCDDHSKQASRRLVPYDGVILDVVVTGSDGATCAFLEHDGDTFSEVVTAEDGGPLPLPASSGAVVGAIVAPLAEATTGLQSLFAVVASRSGDRVVVTPSVFQQASAAASFVPIEDLIFLVSSNVPVTALFCTDGPVFGIVTADGNVHVSLPASPQAAAAGDGALDRHAAPSDVFPLTLLGAGPCSDDHGRLLHAGPICGDASHIGLIFTARDAARARTGALCFRSTPLVWRDSGGLIRFGETCPCQTASVASQLPDIYAGSCTAFALTHASSDRDGGGLMAALATADGSVLLMQGGGGGPSVTVSAALPLDWPPSVLTFDDTGDYMLAMEGPCSDDGGGHALMARVGGSRGLDAEASWDRLAAAVIGLNLVEAGPAGLQTLQAVLCFSESGAVSLWGRDGSTATTGDDRAAAETEAKRIEALSVMVTALDRRVQDAAAHRSATERRLAEKRRFVQRGEALLRSAVCGRRGTPMAPAVAPPNTCCADGLVTIVRRSETGLGTAVRGGTVVGSGIANTTVFAVARVENGSSPDCPLANLEWYDFGNAVTWNILVTGTVTEALPWVSLEMAAAGSGRSASSGLGEATSQAICVAGEGDRITLGACAGLHSGGCLSITVRLCWTNGDGDRRSTVLRTFNLTTSARLRGELCVPSSSALPAGLDFKYLPGVDLVATGGGGGSGGGGRWEATVDALRALFRGNLISVPSNVAVAADRMLAIVDGALVCVDTAAAPGGGLLVSIRSSSLAAVAFVTDAVADLLPDGCALAPHLASPDHLHRLRVAAKCLADEVDALSAWAGGGKPSGGGDSGGDRSLEAYWQVSAAADRATADLLASVSGL